MGNKYGVKGTEVKVGVGLIGVLLAILAVVIIQRSNRQPTPADVAIGGLPPRFVRSQTRRYPFMHRAPGEEHHDEGT